MWHLYNILNVLNAIAFYVNMVNLKLFEFHSVKKKQTYIRSLNLPNMGKSEH